MRRRITPLLSTLRSVDFRLLWTAQVLSELGDWAARVALAVLVYDRTGSRATTAAVTAVGMLPWLGLGQALATLSDRYPRRAVLVATDLIRAAIFSSMILIDSAWGLLVLAFIAAAATPPFEAARSAILPEVVEEDRYGDALTLSNVTFQAVLVLGYLAGGGLVALLGPAHALIVNALSFAGSALLLARLREGRVARPGHTVGGALRRAARTLRADPILRRAAVLTTVSASGAMAGEALVAVYVREHLRAGNGRVGVLAAMIPVGTITASLIVPRHGDPRRLLRASAVLVVACGTAAFAGFAATPGTLGSALSYVALGGIFAVVIPAYSFVGIRLPADVRATAFGLLQGMLLGGQALAGIAGGLLANATGAPGATALALIPAVAYAAFAAVTVPPDPNEAGLG